MYDGSLYGQWEAIVTFQQMIVLSDAEGYVDITPQAMAARTSIPLEIIQRGIELLSQPDKYSRTPDCDGKRIELVDERRPWGWRIINYAKYCRIVSAEEKRDADRIRIAAKREAERKANAGAGVAECSGESLASQNVAKVAHVNGDGNGDRNGKEGVPPGLNWGAWVRWLNYRSAIKKPIREASIEAAQKAMAKLGDQQLDAVEHSIASSYTGLFPPSGQKPVAKKSLSPAERRSRAIPMHGSES